MESANYEFQIEDKTISVTSEEVTTFYGPHRTLTKEEIGKYAARYTALIKYYRACDRWLDKALVHRLLDEERLMKIGEADRFKLQLTFVWFVELKRENIGDFKYTVNACCLDNPQTFCRRYTTMEAALLHCLNGFNENIRLHNCYQSIKDYMNWDEAKQQTVWMRLGASLLGSKEEIGKVLQGDEATLIRLLQERKFNIDGESYIPQTCIESYNNENGTDFEEGDVNFYSLDIAVDNQPQERIYMTPQEQLKQLTEKIVATLCRITEYPDYWLPHSVWVEEVGDTGDPTYRHYMLEKIRPDGTCDLHNPDTGKLEHDDCHLSEINIDWLVTVWNRYIELSIDQGMWKDHAVEVLQEHFDVAEMTIREFVEEHWQNLLLDEDNIKAFKQWLAAEY